MTRIPFDGCLIPMCVVRLMHMWQDTYLIAKHWQEWNESYIGRASCTLLHVNMCIYTCIYIHTHNHTQHWQETQGSTALT